MNPTGRSPGEGTRLLAALTGHPAEPMANDPRALGRGLLALGGIAGELIRDYGSDDPAVREAAERRWAALNALLPPQAEQARPGAGERGGLGPAGRERLRTALTKVVATLEDIERETRDRRSP